jgi:hypothetical protein
LSQRFAVIFHLFFWAYPGSTTKRTVLGMRFRKEGYIERNEAYPIRKSAWDEGENSLQQRICVGGK